MLLRTLYLQAAPTIDGRDGLAGRKLFGEFCARSKDCRSAYRVVQNVAVSQRECGLSRERLSEEWVRDFSPNVVYIEGGLFADDRGTWKIRWPEVESLVERGAVLIVADCGAPELRRRRFPYAHAARFLRARPEFPSDAKRRGSRTSISAVEHKEIVCDTDSIIVTKWLRPALSGTSKIAVRHPVNLGGWENIIAAGRMDIAGTGRPGHRAQAAPENPLIFASAARCGLGYVVFIAGEISADDWTERFPGNARWLVNVSELLVEHAEQNSSRAVAPVASPFSVYLSHRSVNKQLVVRVGEALRDFGVRVWIDTEHAVPGDCPTHETSRGLEGTTYFIVFWSRACLGAPWVERELSAEVSMTVERRLPIFVVRLDLTPVPKMISDAFRIEGLGMSPQELGRELLGAVRRSERNRD